jgi:hypothetical protein
VEAYLAAALAALPACSAQGLANLIYALSLLGVRPPEPWLRAFTAAVSAAAGSMEQVGWEAITASFRRLGYRPDLTRAPPEGEGGGGGRARERDAAGQLPPIAVLHRPPMRFNRQPL